MKKVFVFGTGRCGTVSFNKLFGTIPGAFSMHEGIFKENGKEFRVGDMKEVGKFLYYKNNSELRVKEAHNLSGESLEQFKKSFSTRDELISNLSKKYDFYFDVNPYAHFMIKFIYRKHPDAFFVHLIRDGYDVVNSYHLRTKTTYPPDTKESDYRGYQSGKPRPLKDDRWYDRWEGFNRVQKISWFWQNVNLNIERDMRDIPENQKAIFKLENLMNESFGAMLEKAGISKDFNKSILNKKYNHSNKKLEWDKKNLVSFNKIAAPAMRKFGYKIRY